MDLKYSTKVRRGIRTAVHSTDGLWERLPKVAGLEQTLRTHGGLSGKKGLSVMNEHDMQSITQTSRSGYQNTFLGDPPHSPVVALCPRRFIGGPFTLGSILVWRINYVAPRLEETAKA